MIFNFISLGSEKSVMILNFSGGIIYNYFLNYVINGLINVLKMNESFLNL